MRQLFARVSDHCDLPPLPAVAMRALSLVRDPRTTAEALAKVVSTDAAIAARVLRISRSAMYARRGGPTNLQGAITAVGFETLKKILFVASARSAYKADDEVAERLWGHALATAIAADELAVAAGERRGGPSFIAGLLHDVGRLVFHLSDEASFAALDGCDEVREAAVFGVSHAAVAGSLAEQWGLDDDVVEAITFHHRGVMSRLASRIERADRLADTLGYSVSATAPREPFDADPDAQALVHRVGETYTREAPFFT